MELLTEYKAEEFLKKNNFPVAERKVFTNIPSAFNYAKQLGFPVVLKIASNFITHKTDIHGVIQNVDETNFHTSFNKLLKIENTTGVIVQKYIPGEYILLGLKKDPVFGYVIAVGSGGIYTEIAKDISFRVLPITKSEALNMLKELKIYSILSGARGQKFNISSIISTMLKLEKLALHNKNIKELDINPLVVNKKEAVVIDAKIIFD